MERYIEIPPQLVEPLLAYAAETGLSVEEIVESAINGGNRMTEWDRLHRRAQMIKDRYPVGTRIMLLHMGSDQRPIEPNSKGTVVAVDDIGTVHCDFDNGRSLGMIPGEDTFRTLTAEEIAEEQSVDESEAPTMKL